jgi:hypothetical protein
MTQIFYPSIVPDSDSTTENPHNQSPSLLTRPSADRMLAGEPGGMVSCEDLKGEDAFELDARRFTDDGWRPYFFEVKGDEPEDED